MSELEVLLCAIIVLIIIGLFLAIRNVRFVNGKATPEFKGAFGFFTLACFLFGMMFNFKPNSFIIGMMWIVVFGVLFRIFGDN